MNTNPLTDDLQQTGSDLHEKSARMADKAREEANEAAHCASDYIRENPLCSVLTAAAVGIAVGVLIGSTRHHAPWHERALDDIRGNAGDAFGKLRHTLKFW